MAEVKATSFDFVTLGLVVFSVWIGVWFVRTGRWALPKSTSLDPWITPTMAILLCGAMFLLGGVGAWFGASRVLEPSVEKTAWMYAFALAAQLPVLLAFTSLRRRCRPKNTIPVSILSFAVYVPAALAVAGVFHILFSSIGWEPFVQLGHETLDDLASQPWDSSAWMIVICVTIGAGVFEEVMYRGLILPFFAALIGGNTPWRAIIATSVLFALMHIGPAMPSAILGLFVLSVGLCWARVKSGGVLAPILIHIVFNAMNIAIVYSTNL